MATPCSVKAIEAYLKPILSALEVPNWHLQNEQRDALKYYLTIITHFITHFIGYYPIPTFSSYAIWHFDLAPGIQSGFLPSNLSAHGGSCPH